MYSHNPTTSEQMEISDIIQTLNDIIENQIIYIYRVTLIDEEEDSGRYRGIVLCKEKMNTLPGTNKKDEFPDNSILIWGNNVASNIELPNTEFITKMTCMSISTMLTLQGIEVYVQNKLFIPERGVA